jgi:signal peptidase I
MRTRRSPISVLLAVACVVLFWLVLGPPQIGGSTTYTATVGNSMEPLFHSGDLALTRRSSSYRVGDIVLYMSPVFHRPVLHRIIAVQHGRYFFKGDHNTFVDPGYATRHELLGKLWHSAPHVGAGLSWFGAPAHAALLAAASVFILLLGGSKKVARRSRRHRRRKGERKPLMVTTIVQRNLHRPRKSAENIIGIAAVAVGLVLLVTGFTTPLQKPAQLAGAYRHTGAFTYSGRVTKPNALYPSGTVHQGQPVFLASFETLKIGFSYHFASRLPHGMRGTIALQARISADQISWHNLYTLQRPTPFSGDRASISSSIPLAAARQLIGQLAVDSGSASSEYKVEIVPIVRYHGVVRGHRISGKYSPVLPLSLTQTVLTVTPTAAAVLPGATYTGQSAESSMAASLNPVQPGSIPTRAPTYASFMRYSLPTSAVRGLALALLALALLVPLTKPLRRSRREVWSHEKRIANRYECVIIDVVSLDGVAPAAAKAARVASFESLASLARYSERPILHTASDGLEVYAIEDGGALYVYEVHRSEVAPEPSSPASFPAPATKSGTRRRAKPIAVLLALAVGATIVTGYTAANTVPVSFANASNVPRQVSQELPAACAALAITALLPMSASSVTGTAASELILGKPGTGPFTLNGLGGDDCIVAGGGPDTSNTLNGGTGTNICIGAVGGTNTFTNCSKTYN